MLVSLDVWSEAKACPEAPICASVWLRGAQGSHSDEDCLLLAASAPMGLVLGFPEGAWWSGLCPGNILP